MAVYINGIDRSSCVRKGSISITNAIHSGIDTATLSINENTIGIYGGEEIVITNETHAYQQQMINLDTEGDGRYYTLPNAIYIYPDFTVELAIHFKREVDGSLLHLYSNTSTPFTFKIEFSHETANKQLLISLGSQVYTINIPVFYQQTRHISITHASSTKTLSVYVDGLLVGAADTTGLNIQPVVYNNNALGRDLDTYRTCAAAISHFRIFKYAKSAEQVRDEMYKEIQPFADSRLVAYWRCADGSAGTQLIDWTNNALHATLNIAATNSIDNTNGPYLTHTRIFAGHITEPQEVGDKTFIGYNISCQDYTAFLNGILVKERYVTDIPPADYGNTYYPTNSTTPGQITWTLGKIVRDVIKKYAPKDALGNEQFHVSHVISDTDLPIIDSLDVAYVQIQETFDKLKEATGYEWYVDYYKYIHFFKAEENAAPQEISNTSRNFRDLKFVVDRSQLRNRVYVFGGSALMDPSPTTPTAKITLRRGASQSVAEDTTAYLIPHYPSETKTTFTASIGGQNYNPGAGGLRFVVLHARNGSIISGPLKAGLEGVHAIAPGSNEVPSDYMVLFNTDGIPRVIVADHTQFPWQDGDELWLFYAYKIPVIVVDQDDDSISAIRALEGGSEANDAGVKEFAIQDDKILSYNEAHDRAKAELRQFANPIVNGSFSTHIPGFRAGQNLTVNIVRTKENDGTNVTYTGRYIIQEVVTQSDGVGWSFTVTFTGNIFDATKHQLQKFLEKIVLQIGAVRLQENSFIDLIQNVKDRSSFGEIGVDGISSLDMNLFDVPPSPGIYSSIPAGIATFSKTPTDLQNIYDTALTKTNLEIVEAEIVNPPPNTIQPGQTIQGTYTGSDANYDLINTIVGSSVTLSVTSEFDSQIWVLNKDTGATIIFQDNWGGGTNTESIAFTIQAGINYLVRIRRSAGTTTAYTLSATGPNANRTMRLTQGQTSGLLETAWFDRGVSAGTAPATYARLENQGVTYTAASAGSNGNNIRIKLTNPGVFNGSGDGISSYQIVGTDIELVMINNGVSVTTSASGISNWFAGLPATAAIKSLLGSITGVPGGAPLSPTVFLSLSGGQNAGDIISSRAPLAFTPTHTLPTGTQIRYYFRTSANPDGSNPSRWKTFQEMRTSTDRYFQLKAVFSGQSNATPEFKGFTLTAEKVATPGARYGFAQYK